MDTQWALNVLRVFLATFVGVMEDTRVDELFAAVDTLEQAVNGK